MIMTNLKVLMNKGVDNLPSSSFSLCQKVIEKLKSHISVLIERAIENEIYHIYICLLKEKLHWELNCKIWSLKTKDWLILPYVELRQKYKYHTLNIFLLMYIKPGLIKIFFTWTEPVLALHCIIQLLYAIVVFLLLVLMPCWSSSIFSIVKLSVMSQRGAECSDTTPSLSLPLGLARPMARHLRHSPLVAGHRSMSMWRPHNLCQRLWVTLPKSASTRKSSHRTSCVLHYGVSTQHFEYIKFFEKFNYNKKQL